MGKMTLHREQSFQQNLLGDQKNLPINITIGYLYFKLDINDSFCREQRLLNQSARYQSVDDQGEENDSEGIDADNHCKRTFRAS